MLLYATELDDNGDGELVVKVRVMPECFFARMRWFLRVDRVLVRACDVRLYHDFATSTVVRVSSLRQDSWVRGAVISFCVVRWFISASCCLSGQCHSQAACVLDLTPVLFIQSNIWLILVCLVGYISGECDSDVICLLNATLVSCVGALGESEGPRTARGPATMDGCQPSR